MRRYTPLTEFDAKLVERQIAAGAASIAQILFYVFLVLLVVSLLPLAHEPPPAAAWRRFSLARSWHISYRPLSAG